MLNRLAPEMLDSSLYRRRSIAQGLLWALQGVGLLLLLVNLVTSSGAFGSGPARSDVRGAGAGGSGAMLELPELISIAASCLVLGALLWFNHRRLVLYGESFKEVLRAASEREAALNREIAEHHKTERALHDEKNFTGAIIASLPGVLYVIKEDGDYVRWNDNLRTATGYSDEELYQLLPQDVLESRLGTPISELMEAVFETGSARGHLNLITSDGERVPHLFYASRFMMRNEAYLVGVGVDTSEVFDARAHIQDLNGELQERLERLGALREIDKAITSSLDLDLTLGVVLHQVSKCLGVDASSVLLYKPESQMLRFAAGNGFRSQSALWDTNLRLGEGLAGMAARTRNRIHIGNQAEFTANFVRLQQIPDEEFRSYLAIPLVAKGQLKGVLELFHRSELETGEDWLAFLDMLALQTAIALDNAGLFENLDRSNAELLLAYDTTIEGWARALDLRDHETEGHSRRVTELTVRLSEQAGASEKDLVHIRRGALLHDIGKMGVPDSILLKPGKLEPDEWEEMQRHTTYALELLSPIAFLRPALDIPYCHHERWDGTGYPRGLRGEQIPIAARAFSVVDVYDALTSHRPYRPAWTEVEAVQYLRDNAGTQFDPRMVQVFLKMLEKESPVQQA